VRDPGTGEGALLGEAAPDACPQRFWRSAARAKTLLQYDHGVRPDRRQIYPRVAVHHVEVERLIPWREIYPPDRYPIHQDIYAEP
jgi:hypothetical protein